jgi:hypothetical protein
MNRLLQDDHNALWVIDIRFSRMIERARCPTDRTYPMGQVRGALRRSLAVRPLTK